MLQSQQNENKKLILASQFSNKQNLITLYRQSSMFIKLTRSRHKKWVTSKMLSGTRYNQNSSVTAQKFNSSPATLVYHRSILDFRIELPQKTSSQPRHRLVQWPQLSKVQLIRHRFVSASVKIRSLWRDQNHRPLPRLDHLSTSHQPTTLQSQWLIEL